MARVDPYFCLNETIFNLSSSSKALTTVVEVMASFNKSSATPVSPDNYPTSGATLLAKFSLVLSMAYAAFSAFFKVWSNIAHEIPAVKMVERAVPTSLKQPL